MNYILLIKTINREIIEKNEINDYIDKSIY